MCVVVYIIIYNEDTNKTQTMIDDIPEFVRNFYLL
jgi:hypothetical protein